MKQTPKKTAGEQVIRARLDSTRYDPLEVAEQQVAEMNKHFIECIEKHKNLIDEEEFCVVLVRNVTDPLIKGLRRNKWYAWPYLPSPRPFQTVFLYNKKTDECKRLWSLPDHHNMAIYSTLPWVHKERQQTKGWVDAFYRGDFHNYIRKEHNISMPSQQEYLDWNREKLVEAGYKEVNSEFTDPFDFTKIMVN